MAIQVFCPKCKSSYRLTTSTCKKCGDTFSRNKKYRVTVSVYGKRKSKIFDNLTLAREAEASIKTDMKRDALNLNPPKALPSLNKFWEQYLIWAKENKKSWRTEYYYYKKHLKPRFGKKTLNKITPVEIERMKSELGKEISMRGKPYSQATIKHQCVLLRRIFNLAIKWEVFDGTNPVSKIQLPKIDNEKTEFLTENQFARLMTVLDNWHNPETVSFIKFALFTGLRRGELFNLQWSDIDFERELMTLRDPKGGKTETLPINEPTQDLLRSIEKKSTYIFPGKNEKKRTDFKGPWQRIRKAADLPKDFRLHGLRHHFASTLISNGVDLYTLQKLLTHKDSKTTQRYAHLSDKSLKDAARLAGDLLGNMSKSKSKKPVK